MKKLMVGLAVIAIALVIVGSVFAFSRSLYDLRINAVTFHSFATSRVAPMTHADESNLGSSVSFQQVNLAQPKGTCHRDATSSGDRLGF